MKSSSTLTNQEQVEEEEEEGNEVAHHYGVREERYLLAMASADGIVRLWSATSNNIAAVVNESGSSSSSNNGDGGEEKLNWKCVSKLDHYLWEKKTNTGSDIDNIMENGESSTTEDDDDDDDVEKDEDDEDRPQIYGLQFVHSSTVALSSMNILLVSTNDCIYIWNIVIDDTNDGEEGVDGEMHRHHRKFLPLTSIRFSHFDEEDDQFEANQFGGPRNPDNMLFIFDMQYSVMNDLLGTALSDGTCRITSLHHTNGDLNSTYYHQERCILGLPKGYFGEMGGHLTALAWDKTGTRVATCIGSGRVVLWLLQVVNSNGIEKLHPACLSILECGHDVGRPLYGAKYCGGSDEDLLLTWGVDGKVCAWDSYSIGTVTSPLCTLISHLKNYPIYALDITEGETHIAIAGGGDDGGFFGIPIYIYDV